MTAQPTLPAVEPKPPRRMLRPRKAVLYARVDELERENERLRESRDAYRQDAEALLLIAKEAANELEAMGEPIDEALAMIEEQPRTPWWRRLLRRGT